MLEEIDKGKLAGYAAVGLLVVAIALRVFGHGGGGQTAPSVALDSPPRAASAARSSPAGAGRELYVDVSGAVRHPGLYRVPAGSRVAAAVERAGGISGRGERTGVNLAAPLRDGQQVIVPKRGAAVSPGTGAGTGESAASGGAAGGGPISLSQATEQQLEGLDGIGPTLAGRIIQYRDAHGGFKSIDELRQVSGIGDKRFEALSKSVEP
jgi:competence protein ComEA